MKKNYGPIIALSVALAICIAFLLWPDRQHDTHKDDKADVVADYDTLKVHKLIYSHDDDSLKIVINELKTENKELKQGQATTRRQLDAKTAEVRTYLLQIREINQDTGFFGHMLDSLQQQVESLTFLVVQYEQYADSINNVNDSLKINYEAKEAGKDKRIAELQASYDRLYKGYQDLFADTGKMMKDLRRQKLKTKVAAVLGAAGAVMLLLK
jgi:chromosome segregation ATPase